MQCHGRSFRRHRRRRFLVPDSALWRLASRLCPVTGLRVNRDSELLVRWNAVAGIVFLLVGVVAALLLALTRWQAVHLLEPTWYYRILTLHGLNMLIFFIIFFEMAILYFAGPIVLGSRQPAPKLAWTGFILMLVGALLVDVIVLWGRADVLFTSYVPLKAHPLYYLGIILFAVGALIATLLFFAALVVAKREKSYTGSLPLVSFGAAHRGDHRRHHPAARRGDLHPDLPLVDGIHERRPGGLPPDVLGARTRLATDQRRRHGLGLVSHGRPDDRRRGAQREGEPVGVRPLRAVHLDGLRPPSPGRTGFGPAWKVWNTSYAMYLAVLASMIHGFTVPAGIESGMRLRGFVGRFRRAEGALVGPRLLGHLPVAGRSSASWAASPASPREPSRSTSSPTTRCAFPATSMSPWSAERRSPSWPSPTT